MRRSLWIVWLTLVISTIACIPQAVCAADVPGVAFAEQSGGTKVTMEFKDTPVTDALKQLAKETNVSFAVRGEIPKDLRVTVYLQNASSYTAMRLLCDAAGLACDYAAGGGFIISPRPVATISGVQVPVLGAYADLTEGPVLFPGVPPGATSVGERPAYFFGGGVGATSALRTLRNLSTPRPSFPGSTALVDLDVQGVSFRGAMERLSQSSGVSIVVDKSVPEGMRVTAKIHSLPLHSALSMLLDQARLTYALSETEDGQPEVHIVPPPQVDVDASNVRPAGSEVVTEIPVVWRAMPDYGNRGLEKKWYGVGFDDSAWPTVSTTRMWHLQDGPLKGLTGSYAWGRVKFSVDPKWRGRHFVLRIVALDEEGTVYLNGEKIAGPGALAVEGRSSLDIEVTGKLRFDRPNVLAVRAYAQTTVGGVYRPVTLYAVP